MEVSQNPVTVKVGRIESKMIIKGLETPKDRSELYDDFDIHHELPSMSGSQSDEDI